MMNRLGPISQSALRSLAVAILISSAGATLAADQSYLPAGRPNGIELLPPPPKTGSPEEAADLAAARSVFQGRTEAEKQRALKDSSLAFSLFAPAIGPDFDLEHLPRTAAVMGKVKKDIQEAITLPKNFYQRKRPYQMDPSLTLGPGESSYSYPSGHSTRGTVYAMLLAELFPAKEEAILEIGQNIGWDRVLIGKHFATDINAGRVLGRAIVRELKKDQAFQRDFAAAKAEIAALHAEPALSGAGK
jgi:acid phosphatase (class A)